MTKALAAVLTLALTLPLHADFASVARALDAQHGVKRIWIPFLGVARFLVRVVEPKGVADFQLATFEGAENVDPKKLAGIVRTHAGAGFTPLVQAWSRRSGEWSFVYARPSRNADTVELMILAHDRNDTVLVRLNLDAATVARELQDRPRAMANVRGDVRMNARAEARAEREARR